MVGVPRGGGAPRTAGRPEGREGCFLWRAGRGLSVLGSGSGGGRPSRKRAAALTTGLLTRGRRRPGEVPGDRAAVGREAGGSPGGWGRERPLTVCLCGQLCYDYKFDFEDDQHKIPCHCGAVNCRKWMNWRDPAPRRAAPPWEQRVHAPLEFRRQKRGFCFCFMTFLKTSSWESWFPRSLS